MVTVASVGTGWHSAAVMNQAPDTVFSAMPAAAPSGATAALVFADGTVFWGYGCGAPGIAVGELCFNTGMAGYQETLTDPSYAGQIITFTFPHIGNTGVNAEDMEAGRVHARGLVLNAAPTAPSNWRAAGHLDRWLAQQGLVGISGIDSRAVTRRIRDAGAPNAVVAHFPHGRLEIAPLIARARDWAGLDGMDLAPDVTCAAPYQWNEGLWRDKTARAEFHVVAIDYGAKRNILRALVSAGCRVTVVPASFTAEKILALSPDGIFLSNGPGDPAATGVYAAPIIRNLISAGLPLFGICLGHQLLALALGGRTYKLPTGHRGANQPVQNLQTGKVEITSQNHGFAVDPGSLPVEAEVTHLSLFDGTNEGIRLKGRPVFSVQYHPEASPGPHDSQYLFRQFADFMRQGRTAVSKP